LVSPFLPYPPIGGGHAQIWAWVCRLGQRHELAFAGFCETEAEAPGAAELRRHCVRVAVRLRKPKPHAYTSFAQLPRWVTEFFSAELASDLRRLAAEFRPDVVQFLSSNMAQYQSFTHPAPAVVTALELSFLAYWRRVSALRGLERLQARLDWLRMLRYEAAAFRHADHVVAVSEREAGIIKAVAPRARITAVPPGVDRKQLARGQRGPVSDRVLYLGYMGHYPNLDGLLFLYREIWPEVRRVRPSAQLVVAGKGAREELARVAPETLAAMTRDDSVHLAGFVPDLGAAIAASAALAAPLRLGSGVRNKVIEALAAGLPVVATRRAVEGISVRDGKEALIADDARSFAHQLARLLGDPDLQVSLSARGRELAARDHDNDQLFQRLEQALLSVVGRAYRRRPKPELLA